jgi:16S rRNA (cytosine967-C5)-methyltransferase
MPLSARDIAVRALRDRDGNVTGALRRLLAENELSPVDRGLARELASGVVRRRGTLMAILSAFQKHQGAKLASPTAEILQVAAYQLLFLERVPDFAAVNEAVSQVADSGGKRQRGFVNGILRAIQRGLSVVEQSSVPAAVDVVPIADKKWRKLDRPTFADPKTDPAGYLADAYSLPSLLVERWLKQTDGTMSGVIRWATHANTPAPLIARVNSLKATVTQVLDALAADNVDAVAHENGCSVVFASHQDVTALRVFQAGWIQPQDATATGIGLIAGVAEGMKVLDFCAAPGTKTTHLAERMNNVGEISAVDISDEKLGRVDDNCKRMGVSIVQTVPTQRLGSLNPMDYDVVLADVPCSNSGVLSRRAEARWRFSKETLSRLVGDQKSLLSAAMSFTRPGGRVVYSTCSIEPEECHGIAEFARSRLGLSLLDESLTRPAGVTDPAQWRDGGYYAIFQRS